MAIALDSEFPDRHFADAVADPRPDPRADGEGLAGDPGSRAAPEAGDETHVAAGAIGDTQLVRETFSRVWAAAPFAMEYVYALMFTRHPEMRTLFPLALDQQRERVSRSLALLVRNLDNPGALTSQLHQLGRDHRKFGVGEKHYEPFFDCLLATVGHLNGSYWTAESEAAWRGVLGLAGSVMRSAAAADERRQPAWWLGEIIQHEQRRADLAVLTIRPDRPLRYLPGQYLSVQVTRWPRVWRNYSIANAPRASGLLDLHVRAVPGGMVSTTLVHHVRAGDTVLLGPARGDMILPAAAAVDRDLVCLAGGTGLAPIKAIIEGVIGSAISGRRRQISLFVGARHQGDLYDMADLRTLKSAYPGLTITPVISHDPEFGGLRGILPAVAPQHASCDDSEIFISGPEAMVRASERVLAHYAGARHVHSDPPDAAR